MCVLLCFWLAQQKFITSQLWRPAVRDQGIHRLLPPEGWEGGVGPRPVSSASRWPSSPYIPTHPFHLHVSLSPSFSLLMCFCSVSVVLGGASALPARSRGFSLASCVWMAARWCPCEGGLKSGTAYVGICMTALHMQLKNSTWPWLFPVIVPLMEDDINTSVRLKDTMFAFSLT